MTPLLECARQAPHDAGQASCAAVRSLVAEYLHDWGLRDPEILAVQSRRILEAVKNDLGEKSASPEDLARLAIERTIEEIRMAVQGMALGDGEAPAALMETIPAGASALIRGRDRMPATLLSSLKMIPTAIVPVASPCEMPRPRRPRLWKMVRPAYWRRLGRRLGMRLGLLSARPSADASTGAEILR